MQILVRVDNDSKTTYEWKTVSKLNTDEILTEDGWRYFDYNIIQVKGEARKNKVRCRGCGELITNTQKSIEAHYKKNEKLINCTKCKCAYVRGSEVKGKIKKDENGNFYQTIKVTDNKLYCNSTYYHTPCEDVLKRKLCKFMKCRRDGVLKLNGIHIEFPTVNNRIITENGLLLNGWTLSSIEQYERIYKAKGINLYAHVDANGLLKCYEFRYRSTSHNFLYDFSTKTYIRFNYWNNNYTATKFAAFAENETARTKIAKKIEALYVD